MLEREKKRLWLEGLKPRYHTAILDSTSQPQKALLHHVAFKTSRLHNLQWQSAKLQPCRAWVSRQAELEPPHRSCTAFATTPTTDPTGRLYAMKEAQRGTISKKEKEKENTTFIMIGNVVSKTE